MVMRSEARAPRATSTGAAHRALWRRGSWVFIWFSPSSVHHLPFCGGYSGWVGAQIETTPAAGGVPGSVEEMQEETLSRPVCDFPPLPEVET